MIFPLTLPSISFSNGVAFRFRYGELLNAFTDLPVFRTTSEGLPALTVCFKTRSDGLLISFRSHGGFCVSNSFSFLRALCLIMLPVA
jgi:hypothetical protein